MKRRSGRGNDVTLGIETSCDETSVAVLEGECRMLSNVVASSLAEHRRFGGVVPEIASRAQLETLIDCLDRALRRARKKKTDIGLVAVTQGPGLLGSLLVGVSAAKALALTLGVALVGVDHVLAHAYAGRLAEPSLKFPFLGLVVSGGHTVILRFDAADRVRLLGRTIDDAAGEAFDKVAKTLGLGYPGGPEIDRLARGEDPNRFPFTRPYLSNDSLDFSFSGIKTAVHVACEKLRKKGPLTPSVKRAVSAGFQEAVCEVLVRKALRAADREGLKDIVVGGGVSANTRLRRLFGAAGPKAGVRAIFPSPALCQDNAAMIAAFGRALYRAGRRDGLDLAAYPDFLHERK